MNWGRLRSARSRADTIVLEACCRLDPPFYAPRQIHYVPIALGASRPPFELAHERAYPHLHPFISEPSYPTLLVTRRAFICAIRRSSALILNASYPARTSPPKHWLSQYPRAAWRYSGFPTCFFYFESEGKLDDDSGFDPVANPGYETLDDKMHTCIASHAVHTYLLSVRLSVTAVLLKVANVLPRKRPALTRV
jgi:hypothetical protein